MQLSEMFLFLVNSRHAALNWRTGDPYFCTRARTTGSPHDRSAGPQTDEYMPNPEGTLSFRTSAHRRREGFSMLEQTVCGERLFPAGSLRSVQRDIPIPKLPSEVSKMVALICHDLRLPLTSILANAEFLTQSDISETERNEFYREIRWSIDRMNELVTSLLECSKGRDTLRRAPRNIVDTVERAIRMTSV